MYLRQMTDKKKGRTYLSIAHNYKDQNGKPKVKIIKPLGRLDELAKQYDKAIA